MITPSQPELTPGRTVVVALAAGLAGGLAEGLIVAWGHSWSGRVALFGPGAVWMAPAVQAGLFGAAGVLYAGLSGMLRPLRRPSVAVTIWVAFAALGVILQFDSIHWAAAVLLALGSGTAAARAMAGRSAGRIGGRLVLGISSVVLLLAIGLRVKESAAERLALGRLPPAVSGRPNIVLLVLDTVRAWNLGWHGYGRATTPRLDARWRGGVVFERVLATAPWTLPSHASMFTGVLPADLSAGWATPLDQTRRTVAEALAAAGYVTGGFVANYRYAGSATGLARGFSRYVDYPVDLAEATRTTSFFRRVLRIGRVQEWLGRNRVIEAKFAAEINRDFLTWLDQAGERPFFGFVNYVDGHSPYLPPAPFDSIWTKNDPKEVARRFAGGIQRLFGPGPIPAPLLVEYLDGYDGALSYLDQQIDWLLAELGRRGRLRNTIVIVTADHGEHFGEHGLIQHGNSLYLPLLHVPLVFWGPGLVPGGVRVGAPTSLRHLAATITALAGIEGSGIPGRSLAALWGPDSLRVPPDTVVSSVDWHPALSKFPPSPLLGGSLRSVLIDSLHYIRRTDGHEELYHLGRNILESKNLVGVPEYRSALLEARRLLDAATGGVAGPTPTR